MFLRLALGCFLLLLSKSTVYSLNPSILSYCGEDLVIPPLPENVLKDLEIKQVQVVMRHGDRAPCSACSTKYSGVWTCDLKEGTFVSKERTARLFQKNYPLHKNVNPGNCGLGQLTDKGYQQHVSNGNVLRQTYIQSMGFFSSHLVSEEVYVRSTDMPRTILSAQAFLEGLYPSDEQNSTVLTIHAVDIQRETMFPNRNTNPLLIKYEKELIESDSYKKHTRDYTQPIKQEIADALDIDIKEVDLLVILDCTMAHICNGFDMPSTMSKSLFERAVNDITWHHKSLYRYPSPQDYSRVAMGFENFPYFRFV
eukprot:TRINITY_DN2153_c0_g1_i1.p1 TRINITY_DN2153_c0_g1~~TRINITY_DN2153_c0_g1_i1.p1  ORF type:complete len:310 (+),score=37.84 TRINITY_DN2153_c0_g1_i1:72-1001(+)